MEVTCIVQLSKCTKMQHSLSMLVSTKQELPYSGKFSRVLIFTVYADRLHSAKIKTSKFFNLHAWPLRDRCAHAHSKLECEVITFSQTAGVRVRSRSRWSILLHQRRLMCACTYANTWPVYGCGFTYLSYPRKLKCKMFEVTNPQKFSPSKISRCTVLFNFQCICM